jgi:cobalt-zinc-cadmium efflux system membrane fusion protein
VSRRAIALAAALAVGCGGASTATPSGQETKGATEGRSSAATAAQGGHGPDDGHGHGHGAAAPGPALCTHRVPAELCTRCNPDLAPVFQAQGDWCPEHGVPESQCLECNSKLTFAAAPAPADWCKEHGVPESRCTKCDPRLVAKFVAAKDYCREHGFPESDCPRCHPERLAAAGAEAPPFPAPGTRVVLASARVADEAGIETARVEPRELARTLEVIGQLAFDGNRLAQLSPRAEARVLEVKADLGDDVRAGDPLVVLASASVGEEQARLASAQARLATARSAASRADALVQDGLAPRKEAEEARRELAAAQAEHDAARGSLVAAGAAPGAAAGRHVLRAPLNGTVVSRDAVVGRTVSAGQVLMEVADLSRMWAELEVPEASAARVQPGQPVRVTLEGVPGAALEGKIARVSPRVDPASRTVRARVELPNPRRTLKAGTFLRAEIRVSEPHSALLVPREAVQHVEGRAIVFARREPRVFEPVAVELGEAEGGAVEILGGVPAGAEIVTTGAFLLKTEISKESIGAGCCDLEER